MKITILYNENKKELEFNTKLKKYDLYDYMYSLEKALEHIGITDIDLESDIEIKVILEMNGQTDYFHAYYAEVDFDDVVEIINNEMNDIIYS